MKYCSQCGSLVSLKKPQGDHIARYVCDNCSMIHYQNPKVVAGCIPEWQGKILLCRRAIEPRHGLWTLPAGFMENGETAQQAAIRETVEEANAQVDISSLYTMFSLPHISQVYLIFRARLAAPDFSPGAESLEVELYEEKDIPWDKIAFPVIYETLKRYYQDRANGQFGIYIGDIYKQQTEPAEFTVKMLGD